MLPKIIEDLKSYENPERAKASERYFKTGKGEYGEGDIFLGVRVPVLREIARKYPDTSMEDLQTLLNSRIHENRFVALVMLVNKYKKAKKNHVERMRIFQFYLKNTGRINNWDLVDVSAPKIVGDFSITDGNEIIRHLAKSNNLWEKRIAIISTFAFIAKRNFGETLAISDMLLHDDHDLIHKAVGWALREVGKKNLGILEIFLNTRYKEMPRTMLRYAVEKMPEDKRKKYLKGEI